MLKGTNASSGIGIWNAVIEEREELVKINGDCP